MNAGHSAAELGISETRRAYIEALEGWGYDICDGVDPDWRAGMSDDDMAEAVAEFGMEIAPDIGDFVEALREMVSADAAFTETPSAENAGRRRRAIVAQASLLARCDRTLEAYHVV